MKQLLLLAFGLLFTSSSNAQNPINLPLKKELDHIFSNDQLYRMVLFDPAKSHARLRDSLAIAHNLARNKTVAGLSALMVQSDSININRIRTIIQRYGYPGKSLVGVPTNETAFFVIQHSTRIAQYLPLIKKAAERGELPFRLYAMMLDRYLMHTQKPQRYGTQGCGFSTVNSTTGKSEPHTFIWPIEDPIHVNTLRREAGFDLTVEQNAQSLGIPYQVLTLTQVREMPGYLKSFQKNKDKVR